LNGRGQKEKREEEDDIKTVQVSNYGRVVGWGPWGSKSSALLRKERSSKNEFRRNKKEAGKGGGRKMSLQDVSFRFGRAD